MYILNILNLSAHMTKCLLQTIYANGTDVQKHLKYTLTQPRESNKIFHNFRNIEFK